MATFPSWEAENSALEDVDLEVGHGHFFTKKTFHKPTYCHHCTDIIWGIRGTGLVCEVCNFVVHEKCLKTVVSPCSSIAANYVKNPVPHCWSEVGHIKRKFCNLCRKRLEDSTIICCQICEYYVHTECQDFVVSDCKACATYTPKYAKEKIKQYHHWREGNLPINAKCLLCKRTCWSAECLAGMRCEWCGVTAHANCYQQLPVECSFGCLREILLPPHCITTPRIDLPVETILGITQKPVPPARTVSEEFSSSGDSKTEEDEKKAAVRTNERVEQNRDDGMKIVRIFDGNSSQRKKLYRTVAVPKTADVSVLLEAALRTFHISDNLSSYCLSEAIDADEGEQTLDNSQPIRFQLSNGDGKRPSIFLRYRDRDPDRGHIRVYPGNLRNVTVHFKNIPVNAESTAADVLERALKKFGCEDDPRKYILVEMLLDCGVRERELDFDEKPWLLVKQLRKESLRQHKMTRFYIKESDDPHGSQISLYVGNLPTSLSQKQYEKILRDIVGSEHRWSGVDVIYYEYGALVLLFNCPRTACAVHDVLAEAKFDDKKILVLLLPNIQPDNIPAYCVPLLVLVNVKSGGQQGQELIRAYRKCVNPHQVFNLMQGGPLPGLYVFRYVKRFKIMVCGGDGTVGWALSCLDNVGQDALCASPPMSIIPLGTGNDLARVLRWGGGYSGNEDALTLLRDTIDADEIKLDRWTVIIHPNDQEADETRQNILNATESANLEDQTSIFVMNNYFGIGVDADLSLDFHNAREDKPDKFNSRIRNKTVYLKMGLRKMVVGRNQCKDLHRHIRIELDGKTLDLPPLEGVIILNILSWGSGAKPWGPEKEDQFDKPNHYDGMLEIVGVTGVMHMGQIQSGLRSALRIAQGGHLRIHLFTDLPVHVDGEPWIQSAGQIVVLRSALRATMLKKSKNKMKRRNTEPSIYFPDDPHLSAQTLPQADGESGPL